MAVFLLEAIPESISYISYLIPFTYFVEIIRGLLIKQTLFIDLAPDFLALTLFAVVFVLGSIAKFRKTL